MIAVILISYRFKMNPDNLATPLAASIGDVVSISILSIMASEFFSRINSEIWVLYTVFGSFLALLPFWILIVLKNKYTRSVLRSGWVPILSALLISGLVRVHITILYFSSSNVFIHLNSRDSLVEFTIASRILHLYFPFHVITMPIKRDLSHVIIIITQFFLFFKFLQLFSHFQWWWISTRENHRLL